MFKKIYSQEESGAFVETFVLEPYQSGVLDGLKFAVKDNIDLSGKKTTYGSKPWGADHFAPVYNALCIDQLLGLAQPVLVRPWQMNSPIALMEKVTFLVPP